MTKNAAQLRGKESFTKETFFRSMDIIRTAISKNSLPIRLTYKQWAHIIDSHDYMAGNLDMVVESVENPDLIFCN